MLKRFISVLILFFLFLSAAYAEQDQPRLIEAQEGEPAAMQIRSLESGEAVVILGVESEPRPQTYQEFAPVFATFMKKNFDADVHWSDVLWSDSHWVRLYDAGPVILHAYLTDDTEQAIVREVTLTATEKDDAVDVQALSIAAYWAAAQYGEYGKYTMQIVAMEDHSEDWFLDEPVSIWRENGYQLSFRRTDDGYPQGRVKLMEDVPQTGGFLPFDPESMQNISSERTVEELFARLKDNAENGPLAAFLKAPVLPDTWKDTKDGRIYQIPWDDCLLILYTEASGEYVHSAALCALSGDTVSACMHLYPLYEALAGLEANEENAALLPDLTAGHSTWRGMCALEPYCVINRVMLQCALQEINGNELPIAYICGADER